MVSVAIVDMPVNTIIHCRDLAVWEPTPVIVGCAACEFLGHSLENGRRSLMPTQLVGVMAPERIRIGKGGSLNLVLPVRRHLGSDVSTRDAVLHREHGQNAIEL